MALRLSLALGVLLAHAPVRAQSDEAQSDEAQSDEARSDEAQSDEAQSDEAQSDEAAGRALLDRGRRALAQGHLEESYGLLRAAASRLDDPGVWIEVGEVAEHLRMDEAALEAYRAFLAGAPEAPNRAEIEGRVRVLTALLGGTRFAVTDDGHTVATLVDRRTPSRRATPEGARPGALLTWEGSATSGPMAAERDRSGALVDWHGRRLRVGGRNPLLAVWDARATGSDDGSPALGRALSPP